MVNWFFFLRAEKLFIFFSFPFVDLNISLAIVGWKINQPIQLLIIYARVRRIILYFFIRLNDLINMQLISLLEFRPLWTDQLFTP